MTSDAFNLRTTEFGSETESVSPAGANDSFFISLDEPASSPSADPKPTTASGLSQQQKSTAKPPKRRSRVLVVIDEEEELNWFQKAKRAILGLLGVGLTVSLMFHFFTAVILALNFISLPSSLFGLNVNASISEVQDETFEELDSSVKLSGGADKIQDPSNELQAVVTNDADQTIMENTLSATNIGKGIDSEESSGNGGSGFKFKMPGGGRAVTKGSFTAWTEPKDPVPGQDYTIVIQIKLPSKRRVRNYYLRDLSGSVVGTDGYQIKIPDGDPTLQPRRKRGYYRTHRLKVIKNMVQYSVKVKGGAVLVEDKITIQSKMLKEKQTLKIVF